LSRQWHQELLEAAIAGDKETLGRLLEEYRAYLTVLARRYLDDRIRGRIDENDMVQVTFLEAQRDFPGFRGSSIEELLGWLRNILKNNISSAHQKHLYAQKRSAGRETNKASADSGPTYVEMAAADASSPSQKLMRNEAAIFLAHCMEDLPETQREALRQRYVEGRSLKEIAVNMQKSEMAVAGLLKRGLQALRQKMMTDSSQGGFPGFQ
jgi:RNA polymerase sigma-70 factor, ECF subfamily